MNHRQIIIQFLLQRDGKCCQMCRGPFTISNPPELVHKKPESMGGKDSMDNLLLLHHICSLRRDRMQTEDNDQMLLLEKPIKVQHQVGHGEKGLWGEVDQLIIARIAAELGATGFHQKRTAIRLGLQYRQFRHLLEKYGITKVESPHADKGWVITIQDGTVVWPTEYEPIYEKS